MGVVDLLDDPLYSGQGVSSLVPYLYQVAIAGHPYMVDFSFTPFRRDAFRHRSLPLLRPQADTNNVPGEQSINPQGLWRRSLDSYHHGAAQLYLDRKQSDPNRFHSSKGVDVWTQWQATLLADTTLKRASANTNLATVVVGAYAYLLDGQTLLYSTDLTSWTTVTGTPAVAASSITTDGFNVWVAYGASGVYATTRGAATATQYVNVAVDAAAIVGYANGRLMVGNLNSIYNITAGGALPAPLFTQANTDFRWVGFVGGRGQMYVAGYSGVSSLVYRTTIKTDGTALDAPVVAVQIPIGETLRAIYSYLGYILLGSDLGLRFAQAGTAADPTTPDLTLGSLITGVLTNTYGPTAAVKCFDGQSRFVWFGWTNYDGTSTGLGRLDLGTFIDPITPAFATDLMATTQGAVNSVGVLGATRFFTVSGIGLYAQAANVVASGTIDSGFITYDVSDHKAPVFVDLHIAAQPTGTSIQSFMAADGTGFSSIGSTTPGNAANDWEFPTPQAQVHSIELRQKLNGSGASTPTLYRQTLRSVIAAVSGTEIKVPLILHENVEAAGVAEVFVQVAVELAFLDGLRTSRRIVPYQEGTVSYTVTVDEIDYLPEWQFTRDATSTQGVCVVTMVTVT